MKKVILFFFSALVLSDTAVLGQKYGYFNPDEAVSLMPEAATITPKLQAYQRDSVNMQFQSLVAQYNYKDSLLTKTDTSKMPVEVRNQYRQDLQQLIYQVQNWQAISNQVMDNKRKEFLAPLYQKVYTAMNEVARENGFTFVFVKDALLVAPPANDLLPYVARKLNLKLPAGVTVPNAAPAPRRSAPQKPKAKH